MAVVRKTVSLPEELYKEVASEREGFSEIVRKALEEYLRNRKKEKLISLWGKLKDWDIREGREFVHELRKEQLNAQKEREEWQGS